MSILGKGRYIGTDASDKINKVLNTYSGIWNISQQGFYSKVGKWANPGAITAVQVSVASTTLVLYDGESITIIAGNNPATFGNAAADWSPTVGVAITGSTTRKDNLSAKDYGVYVPTSPFPISFQSTIGSNMVIEMSGGGGNGGGDSTGGGGGGGFVAWKGVVPTSSSGTALVGTNGGSPSTFSISGILNLAAGGGGNGSGGGCSTSGAGGGGGGASGGNLVNQPGQGGGSGSTACGGCSSGGGWAGAAYHIGTFYPDNETLITKPNAWGTGYPGTCGQGTIRYFGGGGGQPGGDNAGGAGGGFGFIRIVYRGGL